MNNEFMVKLSILMGKVGAIQKKYEFNLLNVSEKDMEAIKEGHSKIIDLCHEEVQEWVQTMVAIQEIVEFRHLCPEKTN